MSDRRVYKKVWDPRKLTFCRIYMETGNSQQAYREATGRSFKNEGSYQAYRWLKEDPEIQEILQLMQAEVFEMSRVTLDNHLDELKKIRDAAFREEKYAIALNAEVARGKAAGLYVEKKEITVNANEMSTDQIKAELAKLEEDHKVIELEPDRFRNISTDHLRLVKSEE